MHDDKLSQRTIQTLNWEESGHSESALPLIKAVIEREVSKKLNDLPLGNYLRKNETEVLRQGRVVKNPYIGAIALGEVEAEHDTLMYFVAQAISDDEPDRKISTENDVWEPRVSFAGSTMIPPMDRGGTNLSEYNDEIEIDLVCRKVGEGFRILQSFNPHGAYLVNKYVWILSLRRELDQPNAFSSGTFQSAPGLVLICNSHLERITPSDLAEALLHEAIHCYLFWAENRERRVLAEGVDHKERLDSPWSGAAIGVHSAVHAIAVWFGLFKHYRYLEARGTDTMKDQARERLLYIGKGFQGEGFGRFTETLEKKCSPFGQKIISELKDNIRRSGVWN